jgi:hypothetical protein
MVAEEGGGDGARVHGVAHGGRGAGVAGDGLHHHGGADMVLAHAAQLLRDQQAEQAVLGEDLEILARKQQLLVRLDGVVAHLLLCQLDDERLNPLLLVREQPLRIELETQAPELYRAPFFRHFLPRRDW